MQGKERQLGVSLRIQIRPRSAAQFCSRAWFHSRPGSSGSGWHTQTWSWIDSGPECFLACIFYRSAGFLTTSFFFSCFPNLSTYHTPFNLTGDKQAINKKKTGMRCTDSLSQQRAQTTRHEMPLPLFVLFTFLFQFYRASVESSTNEDIIILSTTAEVYHC